MSGKSNKLCSCCQLGTSRPSGSIAHPGICCHVKLVPSRYQDLNAESWEREVGTQPKHYQQNIAMKNINDTQNCVLD